jgi:hypothetical protein
VRVEETPEGYRVFLALPEGDERRFDARLSDRRLDIALRPAPPGANEVSRGPWSVTFARPVDGARLHFSADVGGIHVLVPKDRSRPADGRAPRPVTAE